jgi:hypothetical protein
VRYRDILEKRLVKSAESKGFRLLKQLDLDALHEFPASWIYAPVSSQKRLQHSSVKITEKHDSPWVKARREQLETAVRIAW